MGDAATDAERAFKKPKATVAELRQALTGLLGEHRLLHQWYKKVVSERDQAYVLLRYMLCVCRYMSAGDMLCVCRCMPLLNTSSHCDAIIGH